MNNKTRKTKCKVKSTLLSPKWISQTTYEAHFPCVTLFFSLYGLLEAMAIPAVTRPRLLLREYPPDIATFKKLVPHGYDNIVLDVKALL